MTVKAPEQTRGRILQSAYEEFHRNGFQGASINSIVTSAGITKGALFHHFSGKNALGYAVVEEVLKPMVRKVWVEPMIQCEDPIQALKDLLSCFREDMKQNPTIVLNGCPVNNLAQEMSPLDEEFRTRLEAIYDEWRGAIAAAFARGIENGTVRPEVSPAATAVFLVSAFEGIIGAIKSSRSITLAKHAVSGLFDYLDSLAPRAS
jgi:TetR/AcrR family transcriptional repressor of nem operon